MLGMRALLARWRTHRWFRPLYRTVAVAAVASVLAVAGSVTWVHVAAHGHVYSVADVPPAPVALVLGDLVEPDGTPSPFLAARLEIAARLYRQGTVSALLVSGDNSRPDYDEPDVMRAWLVSHDVPPVKVVADYAGFDTYDSCVRARKVFGADRVIIVSQSYHLPRAIAVCRRVGVVADGVGDDSVASDHLAWDRAWAREQVADVKAVWDTTTGRNPVFLGPREPGIPAALAAPR
jgi:vancomycin permeability regulator SanA